jgi:hypothetical protein
MSVTDELLANNTLYVDSFDKGDLPLPPGKKVAVLACMDARLNVYGAAISQRLLGTEEIILIHHTDCGMLRSAMTTSRPHPAGGRDQAGLGRRGVQRPRRGRPPVDRPDQGEPVHPHARPRARVRDRREDGRVA